MPIYKRERANKAWCVLESHRLLAGEGPVLERGKPPGSRQPVQSGDLTVLKRCNPLGDHQGQAGGTGWLRVYSAFEVFLMFGEQCITGMNIESFSSS